MIRLIDADKLLENKFKNDISWNAFEKLIKRQTTIDAVEVVRCEDCVYYRKSHKGESGDCIFDNRHTFVLKDDFCSYGERREVKE